MPRAVVRPDFGHHLEGQRSEESPLRPQIFHPQQAVHSQAAPEEMQRGHQVEAEGQRKEQPQVMRRIPGAAQRVGGEGRAAQNQGRPPGEGVPFSQGALQVQGVGVVRDGKVRIGRPGEIREAVPGPEQKQEGDGEEESGDAGEFGRLQVGKGEGLQGDCVLPRCALYVIIANRLHF
ncbi:MAG TPA: hypothetical protein ENJ02_03260 [Chloroflexi bacterium]|nr:hypothetical protein [Chloroflexota bacterium]